MKNGLRDHGGTKIMIKRRRKEVLRPDDVMMMIFDYVKT